MSDISRALRRRTLASLASFAALAAAPTTLVAATRGTGAPGRFEAVAVDPRDARPAALQAALEPLRNQAVLVNFWATWCEPCRAEMPALVRLDAAEAGLALLTVAVADREGDVRRFFAARGLDPLVVADPEQVIARAWDVRFLPTTFLLDASHRPRHRIRGELDWNDPAVRERVMTLVAPPNDPTPH